MALNLPGYVFANIQAKLGAEKAMIVDKNWMYFADSCINFSSLPVNTLIKEAKMVLECVEIYGDQSAKSL